MARSNRVIRTTKYKLNDLAFENPEQKTDLEGVFREYERYKASLVEEYRKVAEQIAELDIARAMATKCMGKFLRQAGEVLAMVKVEPQWWIYRDKDGNIILESAFTERDVRNANRAQKAALSREVQAEDGADLFEADDNEKEDHDPIGF